MRKTFLIDFFCLLILSTLCMVTVDIHASDVSELNQELDFIFDDPQFEHSIWGVRIEKLDGEVIYDRNGNKNLIPASNMKIYTTAAALDILGADFQYETRLEAQGNITPDGLLEGSLVIVGSGDPSLGSWHIDNNTGSYVLLKTWVDNVKQAGIKEISGDIIGDGRVFSDDYYCLNWDIEDIFYWYGTGSSGLAIEENCFRFTTAPGKKVGDKAIITIDPDTKYIKIENEVITANPNGPKTADIVWRDPESDIVRFAGAIPVNAKPFMQRGSVWDGTLYTATLFKEALEKESVKVNGIARNIRDIPDPEMNLNSEEKRTLLATYISPPLSELIAVVNKPSHNFFADQILRTLGCHAGDEGSFKEGAKVVKKWLKKIGAPNADSFLMQDGSGLARRSFVEPAQICSILRYMINKEETGKYFYDSLPIAGVDGDLKNRMKSAPTKGNVHAKTGFISHVRSLSGYVTAANGEMLVFSMIANNFTVPVSHANKLHDKACRILAKYGEESTEMKEEAIIQFEKVIDGLEFPEGPAWNGKDTLYFSDCLGKTIYQISPDGTRPFIRSSTEPFNFEKTNGLTVSGDGDIYACEFSIGAILRISSQGECESFVSGYDGKKFNRPNDLIFDSIGNLYFTDPNKYTRKDPDGVVYIVYKGSKEVKPVAEGLGFPNGVAVSPDGKNLFVCESAFQRILKFDIENDGTLSNKEVFAEMPGGDPDGLNFDSEGNLWAAHFGGGAIYVFAPDGTIMQKISAPGKKPSNIEFAGDDLRTLYLTEDDTKAVYKTRVDTPGQPLSTASVKE